MKHETYESPLVEVMDVEVEKGFATSEVGQLDPWGDAGEI